MQVVFTKRFGFPSDYRAVVHMFTDLLNIQHNLNSAAAGANWVDLTNKGELDYALACSQEIGEFHDAFDQYKWWAKKRPDVANMRTELIDALHFGLSVDIAKAFAMSRNENVSFLEIGTLYAKAASEVYTAVYLADPSIQNLTFAAKQLQVNLLQNNQFFLPPFFKLCRFAAGMSVPHLCARYKSKAILNHFRQDHGYKTGGYHKMWDTNREDNYFLADYIDTNFEKDIELTEREIKTFLETKYAEVTKSKG